MPTRSPHRVSAVSVTLLATLCSADAAERLVLDDSNYAAEAPKGKEADAIYGDILLKSDRLVAVIGQPLEGRDANMTVRNVGGSVIDLTRRDAQSDQLSCFYPGGGGFRFSEEIAWPAGWDPPAPRAARVAFAGEAISVEAGEASTGVSATVGYELRDGEDFVRVASTLKNTGDAPYTARVADGVRADGEFTFGIDYDADLWWAYDQHWRQAYGLQPEGVERQAKRVSRRNDRRARQAIYPIRGEDSAEVALAPGESITWRRRLFPAKDNITLQSVAYRNRGVEVRRGEVLVNDDGGDPVANAEVRVIFTPPAGAPGERVSLGIGLTDAEGRYDFELPAADYGVRVRAQGHDTQQVPFSLRDGASRQLTVTLSEPSYVRGAITDSAGESIPAKVQFIGLGKTRSPKFGPPSAIRGVENLQYTPDGRFEAKLKPGRYRWVASHGPEYDAAEGEFDVAPCETAAIEASLERTVDTTGWLSAELHSHSSPSGDNTASQRGRVLNLLAEQLEFCPCTEHQRIDVYDKHLRHFAVPKRMLTCPGMELTGQPLPLNHQNAFPLVLRPHEQHGGGPTTDPNPVTQIRRLAHWDGGSEKLIQTNHPNVAQMIGDRDLDGEPDAGFEEMFGWMDVMEVHPPELIFEPLGAKGDPNSGVGNGGWEGRGNVIVNWLQLLNLGYRIPGVVNTDAHYNHHGSGWLRNWVRSSTDDPAKASVAELVHEFEAGHVVMSNGPYLEVEARSADSDAKRAIPGDDLAAPGGKAVVRVIVRCPNWLEVNRVQLFLNGRPAKEHDYTFRSHEDWFGTGPDVFNHELPLDLVEDTHVVVAACGEGRQLGAIYGEKFGAVMPVAVANPIFVDVDGDQDGDGATFEANGDGLGLPLPAIAGRRLSGGHGHRH